MLLSYRVRRLGPALREEPLPVMGLALSAVAHVMVLTALAMLAGVLSQWNQSRVYVVNLVPAVAAIGAAPTRIPQTPSLPPRPEAAEPPSPTRESVPPEPKTRPALPETSLPQARSPTRPPALPRPGEKESPSLASSADQPDRRTRESQPPRAVKPAEVKPAPPTVARPAVAPIPLGRPGGSPVGTASLSLDVSDFPFTYYLRQIQQKVSEKWVPPGREAEPGNRVVVLFEIGRDGQVRVSKVERSSGNAIYDQSALRAITEASPFPPLPQEFPASFLRVHFGFEFQRG